MKTLRIPSAMSVAFLLSVLILCCGCENSTGGSFNGGGGGGGGTTAPELGDGDGSPGSVTFTQIASSSQQLYTPRDLAFNPNTPDELWVLNGHVYGDGGSFVVVSNATTDGSRTYQRVEDGNSQHFMRYPAAFAFGANSFSGTTPAGGTPASAGTFATTPEAEFNGAAGSWFRGPTLWSSSLDVFGQTYPAGANGAHLDMLHCTAFCMGIAWEGNNVYWVFSGDNSGNPTAAYRLPACVTRYDFNVDHGPGQHDHSDAKIRHFPIGNKRETNVPSHMEYDSSSQTLYINDTGNGRVLAMDTTTGSVSATPHSSPETYVEDDIWDGASVSELISAGTISKPCGMVLDDGRLFISDYATGRIYAYDLSGNQIRTLDTGLTNRVMGLAMGPDDKLYFVDSVGDRVYRIDP